MTTSETIGAIAPALIKAQSQMQGITKEGKNPAFRSKYVTLDSILDTLRPILTSNGLMLTQGSQEPQAMQAVTVESRIIHTSGEWIATTVTIPVTKPDAHGLGSALTYGRRYSVSALLAISADEDDDANGAVQAQDGSYEKIVGSYGKMMRSQSTTTDEPVRPAPGRPLSR